MTIWASLGDYGDAVSIVVPNLASLALSNAVTFTIDTLFTSSAWNEDADIIGVPHLTIWANRNAFNLTIDTLLTSLARRQNTDTSFVSDLTFLALFNAFTFTVDALSTSYALWNAITFSFDALQAIIAGKVLANTIFVSFLIVATLINTITFAIDFLLSIAAYNITQDRDCRVVIVLDRLTVFLLCDDGEKVGPAPIVDIRRHS